MPSFPVHQASPKRIVISLGGSLIIPDRINDKFLKEFRAFVSEQVDKGWQFVITTGGGNITRVYQEGAKRILGDEVSKDDLDWLGIHTTRVNAHLMRTVFYDLAQPVIVMNPEESEMDEDSPVIIAGGWKPGWSTDYVASKLAERIKAPFVVNITNVSQVYDADPKKNPDAKPIEIMSWKDYREMIGDEWTPGMNIPFDPIAAKLCQENDITALIMNGTDIDNLR